MPMPQWGPEYNLGNRRIDQEHQKLMELLLWLETELLSDRTLDPQEIRTLVRELDAHVNDHFRHEEVLMASLSGMPAPERVAHRRDHDHWRRRVQEHLASLESAATELELRGHLARVLLVGKAFWEEHFRVYDRRMETYLGT